MLGEQPKGRRSRTARHRPFARASSVAVGLYVSAPVARVWICRGGRRDERVQPLMVEQGFHDQRTSIIEARNKWEQRLLFAEVRHVDGGEEAGERSSCCLGIVIAIGGFSETPRLNQRMVVVMRQRNQSRVALHNSDGSCRPTAVTAASAYAPASRPIRPEGIPPSASTASGPARASAR
jgi:hypothetical protein